MTGVFGDATSGTNLQTALQTAIDQCVTLGVPIANTAGGSSVTSFFAVPRVTLNQSTCAQVIAELVRLVPDAMVYFDYTTATPTIQITRRGVATTRTLTIGTDPIESIDVQPIYEMKVDRVELPFVTRNTIGLTQFDQQASGTAAAGRVQIITVSGTELDTFLPNDIFDQMKTTGFPSSDFLGYAITTSTFSEAVKNGLTSSSNLGLNGGSYFGWSSSGLSGSATLQATVAGRAVVNNEGNNVSLTGKIFLQSDKIPDWSYDLFGLQEVNISGIASYLWISDRSTGDPVALPSWVSALPFQQTDSWYRRNTSPVSTGWERVILLTFPYQLNGFLASDDLHYQGAARAGSGAAQIVLAAAASTQDGFYVGATVTWRKSFFSRSSTITAYNGATKAATLAGSFSSSDRPASGDSYKLSQVSLYQPADYTFISPPAGLAANLLASQNFVPYEGQITLTEEVAGGTRYRGCKINLVGSLSDHASMGALVADETLNIANGQTAIGLGTPPRLDYRTFVDRIRKTPQDNIVFV
jgi:hypothetical protein